MSTERIITSKNIYNGKIVKLDINEVELSNGQISNREVVYHKPGVSVVAIDNKSNLLLVKQFRSGIGQELIEIPAGLVENGENPIDAARRELQEEIGYDCNNLQLLCSFYPSPGFCNEITYIYLATNLIKSTLPKDKDEFIELIKLPISDISKLYNSDYPIDGKTILGITLALNKLSEQNEDTFKKITQKNKNKKRQLFI